MALNLPYSLNTHSAHPSGIGLLMAECSRGFKETIKQSRDERIDAKSDSLEPEFSHYGKQKVDEADAMPNRLAVQ
ncbi:hypothetical protein U2P60_12490 [Brucella sp. H1_1004]|uniref:hypothetical protein n=1 Tax=Brucella sp. H1_1004 TaxID=3110109 RepID=UPI0039B5641B